MSPQGWIVFAAFWAVFVASPGPNAVNTVSTAMALGIRRTRPAVGAGLGRMALGATTGRRMRRAMSALLAAYGVALGASALERPA